jgi:Tol biopolymer transport system component/DNA-binding winged helix-turn-helix (wHTH) protein
VRGVVSFGVFEADLRTRELRKQGVRLKLPHQSFQILQVLLERRGELVSRDELRQLLWPADTFVDFDHGLNNAIKRIRDALNDSAETPRYIETLPRLGYRFIGSGEGGDLLSGEAGVRARLPSATPSSRLPWRLLVPIAGIGLVAAIISILLWHKPASQTAPLTIIPFTTYPGPELFPSFSPDGNQIAFAWNRGDESRVDALDLYVKQLGSEIPRRLTNHPATYLLPAWSPDGRFIAFSRGDSNGSGIYMLPVLGGPERKLVDTTLSYWFFGALSWSPDGKQLAYTDADKPVVSVIPPATHIHLLNMETLGQRVLAPPSPDCTTPLQPAFAPDGKSLALACMISIGVGRIYVQPLPEGPPARELLQVEGDVEGLAWSADGKSLIYSVHGQLWRIPATGGKAEQLLFGQNANAPTAARMAQRLGYVQGIGGLNIWRIDLASPTKPRRAPIKLLASTRGQQAPRISPEGKHIAFESSRSGSMEIWLCDIDGSNPVQLTSFGGPVTGTPRWSPDGREIVFDSRVSGHPALYVVSISGGPPRLLPTGTGGPEQPFWSKDGHWVYFLEAKEGTIWKVPATGGTAVRLTKNAGSTPQESADGTRIFYSVGRANRGEQLWSASANGGDERPVMGMPILASSDQVVPARAGLYFIDGYAIPPTLNLFNPATQQIQRLSKLGGQVADWGTGLSVSANGRTLVYAQSDLSVGDIVLVEGFR